MLLITESLKGSHYVSGADLISTRGSAAVLFNKNSKSYTVVKGFIEYAKNLNRKVAFVGTDLDHVGTKVATVIGNALENEGIKAVRLAFTEKGYMKVGRFYGEKEMKACAEIDAANINNAAFFAKKFNNLPFKVGLARAIVVGAVASFARQTESFKVKTQGTSTAVAVTKGVLSGYSVGEMVGKLNQYYTSGLIEYPRVDNDYILDGYDVYAHPPLTSRGFSDNFISPFEADELPLNRDTVLMLLSQERLVTPSMLKSYQNTIEEVFTHDLKPKPGKEEFVKECEAIYREMKDFYVEQLRTVHPHFALVKVPSPQYFAAKKRKDVDSVIDEWLERVKKKIESEEEQNKKAVKETAEIARNLEMLAAKVKTKKEFVREKNI